MVEMRWLLRKRKELPPDIRATSNYPVYKVLQYRYQIDKAQWGPICSEWIDVPTVVEGDK